MTRIDELIGTPDGVETRFETPADYVPGSTRVWRNGQLQTPRPGLGDAWTEDPPRGIVFVTPPVADDVLQAHYVQAL